MADQPLALHLIKVGYMRSEKFTKFVLALFQQCVSLAKTKLFESEDRKRPVVLSTSPLQEAEEQLHKKNGFKNCWSILYHSNFHKVIKVMLG